MRSGRGRRDPMRRRGSQRAKVADLLSGMAGPGRRLALAATAAGKRTVLDATTSGDRQAAPPPRSAAESLAGLVGELTAGAVPTGVHANLRQRRAAARARPAAHRRHPGRRADGLSRGCRIGPPGRAGGARMVVTDLAAGAGIRVCWPRRLLGGVRRAPSDISAPVCADRRRGGCTLEPGAPGPGRDAGARSCLALASRTETGSDPSRRRSD